MERGGDPGSPGPVQSHVDPAFEVILNHQKHVIALLCRRHGGDIAGIAGDGYGSVLHKLTDVGIMKKPVLTICPAAERENGSKR